MKEESMINYLLGECTMEERKEMEKWMAESGDHTALYQQTVRAWEWSRKLVDTPVPDVDAAWGRFIAKREQARKSRVHLLSTRNIRMAASVLLLAVTATVLYLASGNRPEMLLGKQLIAADAIVKDTLADGTVITLNKNSAVHVQRSLFANKRAVKMEAGEAFFEVARDERKPFEVWAGETKITVLGTSFNVHRTDHQLEVIVSTGQVAVTRKDQSVNLQAMQRVIVNEQMDSFVSDQVDALLHQHYVNDRFVLRNTPLVEVVKLLGDEYGATILIADPAIEKMSLTATLGKDPLDQLLKVIAETLEIKVSYNNNTYILHQ